MKAPHAHPLLNTYLYEEVFKVYSILMISMDINNTLWK